MAPSRPDPRLVAAMEQLVDEDVAQLIAEARIEARERVRRILVDALTEAMLERARAGHVRRPPQPTSQPTPDPPAATPEAPAPLTTHEAPSGNGQPAQSGTGLYVYCVVRGGAEIPAGLDGIDRGHSPKAIRHNGLAAVVSAVPLEDFTEERLRQHLSDMEWIERAARTHEQVLEAIAEQATLIPMRLCSVYGNERGVLEMLMREAPALTDALQHLEGKAEWGLKVFAPASDMTAEETAGTADSGTDYMRQRQSAREAKASAGQRHHEVCVEIHERLAESVADAQSIPVQRPEVSGYDGQMLLNGVYLVEDDQRQAFLLTVEELQEEYAETGLELLPTGPWPAYNFVPGTIGAAW